MAIDLIRETMNRTRKTICDGVSLLIIEVASKTLLRPTYTREEVAEILYDLSRAIERLGVPRG